MAIMEWSSKLDIGVDKMNDQHKGLLDIMNKLHNEFLNNSSFPIQLKLMKSLADATTVHFSEEEKLMESIGFEKVGVHKTIHKDLLQRYMAHMESAQENHRIDDEFFSFLKFWLSAHIIGIDTQYAKLCT